MDSKLEVKSEVNKGSEFFFELPLQISDNIDLSQENTYDHSKLKFLEDKKILIAEDNKLNQKLINAILNNSKIDFTIVNNGKETIDILNAEHFDLILMDGQMPVMDGLEATNIIRNSEKDYKDIPIIALTASALIGDKQKFLDAGMNDYISKPIDTVELFDKMLMYTTEKENIKKNTVPFHNNTTNNTTTIKHENEKSIIILSDFENKKKIFAKESYTNILNLLLNDLETKTELIEKYIKEGDSESLRLQTHSLKGILSNFEAPKLNDLCKELDKYAVSENPKLLKETLDKVKALTPQYRSEILEFIKTL
jgi:CheY-like chemotaxis protein